MCVAWVPHQLQLALSSNSQPLLAEVIPQFELYMQHLDNLEEKSPMYSDAIEAGLEVAHKYYQWMDRMDAYIICMCESSNWALVCIADNAC